MAVWNKDLVVQLLNKLLNKADLTVAKTDDVLADTKQILTAVSGGIGVIKSVQKGTARFTGEITSINTNNSGVYYASIDLINSLTIKINNINPAKSLLLIGEATLECRINTSSIIPIHVYISELTADSFTLKIMKDVRTYWGAEYSGGDFVFNGKKTKVGDVIPMNHTLGWQLIEYY